MQLIANELLNQCRWPEQPPRYAAALREAVIYIVNRYDPVGIVACGTIIRGAPDEASDLDLYVIHGAPRRQRVQKFFGGVPAEMFVNPPVAIRRYFREQHAAGRPLTAHMLATGWIVLSRDGIIETLCREAAAQFIADRTIDARGFFEWETEPEDVTTSAGEGPGR